MPSDLGLIPGPGISSRAEMAIGSDILAWKIPQTEEPGGLQFMQFQRIRHDWVCMLTTYWYKRRESYDIMVIVNFIQLSYSNASHKKRACNHIKCLVKCIINTSSWYIHELFISLFFWQNSNVVLVFNPSPQDLDKVTLTSMAVIKSDKFKAVITVHLCFQ